MGPEYGYHKAKIPKGVLGQFSKIYEETLELQDAIEQQNHIMALCELADLYGAMREYLLHHHPDITMDDVRNMANATTRAFQLGHRK